MSVLSESERTKGHIKCVRHIESVRLWGFMRRAGSPWGRVKNSRRLTLALHGAHPFAPRVQAMRLFSSSRFGKRELLERRTEECSLGVKDEGVFFRSPKEPKDI